MYKFGVWLVKRVILALVVAAIMTYLYQGTTVMTYGLAGGAVICALFLALMVMEHRHKQHNQPTASLPLLKQQDIGALALVHQLPERPVMYYKGDVFDFVHNDPTQPDPVRVLGPAT